MAPILTKNNPRYGQAAGQNKYSPLKDLELDPAENSATCIGLVNGRIRLLAATSIFPANLALVTDDWDAVAAREFTPGPGGVGLVPNLAPIVVVSSNRSKYIKAGAAAAFAALPNGAAAYNNIADVRSLLAAAHAAPSPPVYLPLRLGLAPRRNVYAVVHESEYLMYKVALGLSGITVIGWSFDHPDLAIPPMLTGFGATRYAAIEFCKHLRTIAQRLAPAPAPPAPGLWTKAWIFDDNVVGFASSTEDAPAALTPGFPDLLTQVEEAMTAATVVAGFKGLSLPKGRIVNRAWAQQGTPADQSGLTNRPLPPVFNTGLVQQAALWNIALLQAQNINFSANFIASKEDVSLAAYFDLMGIAYQWYDRIKIIKEFVLVELYDSFDSVASGAAAQRVTTARQGWESQFSGIAANLSLINPVDAINRLSLYVQTVVLPFAHLAVTPANEARAACCAIEQIVTRAIRNTGGTCLLGESQLNSMFKIVATSPQTITATDQ